MTKQELYNECDLLTGNINRMCVTDSLEELDKMKEFAEKRIKKIYNYNLQRFNKKEKKMTNREKINNMTNEELSFLLCGISCDNCPIGREICLNDYTDIYTCSGAFEKWLESEV